MAHTCLDEGKIWLRLWQERRGRLLHVNECTDADGQHEKRNCSFCYFIAFAYPCHICITIWVCTTALAVRCAHENPRAAFGSCPHRTTRLETQDQTDSIAKAGFSDYVLLTAVQLVITNGVQAIFLHPFCVGCLSREELHAMQVR